MPSQSLTLQPVAPPPDQPGFPLQHAYVEHVYAAIVGPTSVAVLRRAALLFEAFPGGVQLDQAEFAASLGIGHVGGNHSALLRTMGRLDRFGLGSWDNATATLTVPTQIRPVPDRWLARLPESTRAVHDSLVASLASAHRDRPTPSVPTTPTGPAITLGLSR